VKLPVAAEPALCCGLRIQFGLSPGGRSTPQNDVVIRVGDIGHPIVAVTENQPEIEIIGDVAYLCWPRVGAFAVCSGREIIVEPAADVDPALLTRLALGPVLAVLLYQRSMFLLHASTIALEGEAVAFAGSSGQGKSTLAAALYARGAGAIADDLTVLDFSDSEVKVLVGMPELSLWPDAAECLGIAPASLPHAYRGIEKRVLQTDRACATSVVPLRRIYVLAEGDAHAIETLAPTSALIELVRHSYGLRVVEKLRPAAHFRQCAALANAATVQRLRVRRSLAALHELAGMIEDDIALC
jgi:hypothetical protein